MKKIVLVLLAIPTFVVNADVFKCKLATGVVEYQSTPCASTATRLGVVDTKPLDAQQEEQARRKLQVWHEEQQVNEKLRIQVQKEHQAEQEKLTELNALTRSATAAEQQALAAQELAGQVERQNRLNSHNSLYEPRHRYGNYENREGDNDADDSHRRRHGHEGRHERKHDAQVQHQPQLGDYGVYRPEGSLGNAIK